MFFERTDQSLTNFVETMTMIAEKENYRLIKKTLIEHFSEKFGVNFVGHIYIVLRLVAIIGEKMEPKLQGVFEGDEMSTDYFKMNSMSSCSGRARLPFSFDIAHQNFMRYLHTNELEECSWCLNVYPSHIKRESLREQFDMFIVYTIGRMPVFADPFDFTRQSPLILSCPILSIFT
uniref:Uncharacterized protein n=1 Tax=Romanomermis culicivorax TaxID=13658 RepID=A0A915L699_ROMCU